MEIKTHFGNPLIEQRNLAAGLAKVFLAKSVIEVSGEDRLEWLHSMLTSDFLNLKPGLSREALLLDVNGHVLNEFHAVALDDAVWLIVDTSAVASLMTHFDRMIFRSKVEVRDRSADFAIFGLHGDAAASEAVEATWVDGWPLVALGGARYAASVPSGWKYREVVVKASEADTFAPSLLPAGTDAQLALRIAAHRPAVEDVDARSLPHEHDWLASAVHLTKGCYRGQEAVAKTHNLGHPPRRLTLLHLDGSNHSLPERGDEVELDGAVVGTVANVAQHHEAGPIAFALLKRNAATDAELLVVGSSGDRWSATQEIIVPPTAGKANDAPRRNLLMGKGH